MILDVILIFQGLSCHGLIGIPIRDHTSLHTESNIKPIAQQNALVNWSDVGVFVIGMGPGSSS